MTGVLGLITARAGSKRIPGKNMRLLGGIPLIGWTISAALEAELLDDIVVSSDSDEILAYAASRGVETLRRPAELATDEASSYDVILHALDTLPRKHEAVCLLQPTSPFRTAEDIDWSIAMCQFWPAAVSIDSSCKPNGAVYVGNVEWLRGRLAAGETHPFDGPVAKTHFMPDEWSIDIDTEEDWAAAEALLT